LRACGFDRPDFVVYVARYVSYSVATNTHAATKSFLNVLSVAASFFERLSCNAAMSANLAAAASVLLDSAILVFLYCKAAAVCRSLSMNLKLYGRVSSNKMPYIRKNCIFIVDKVSQGLESVLSAVQRIGRLP